MLHEGMGAPGPVGRRGPWLAHRLDALGPRGRACGTGKLWSGGVFLAHGPRGFARPWLQERAEIAPLVDIITPPQRPVARGVRAGHEAQAPIGGHAKAGAMGGLQRCTRRSPRCRRTIRRQLTGEDRRASRVHGAQHGSVEGPKRIAQRQHTVRRRPREGGRQRLPSALEAWTELSHGVGVVFQRLEHRSHTPHRAFACHASPQEQWGEVTRLLWPQELCIAQQQCQLQVRHKKQVGEQCPRYLIGRCDLRHLPVNALRQPSEHDHRDPGLPISVRASHTLHRFASGGWGMVMNRHDSMWQSPSSHRQRFR